MNRWTKRTSKTIDPVLLARLYNCSSSICDFFIPSIAKSLPAVSFMARILSKTHKKANKQTDKQETIGQGLINNCL